jgi:flagellar biosynthesis/type III secretory pathway protein FliH
MHDLACPDPNQMHYEVLADRVRFFKENEKGVSAMCKVFEELRQEGIQEGIQEGMQRGEERRSIQLVHDMLAAGKYALEEIAALSGLPLSEIQRIQAARETP